jgi:two-component system, OmpR family, phosphate regulon response regulator PhoB
MLAAMNARHRPALVPRVLIVDDDERALSLMNQVLQLAGYETVCTGCVSEASAYMNRERPDVLLIDWELPDTPGPTFIRQLRRQSRLRDLPIMLVSGRSAPEDTVAGLESGADDYITKPFSCPEMLARLKAVLRGRAPHLCGDLVEAGALRLDPISRRVNIAGHPVHLHDRDFRLLHFFMTHQQQVFSRCALLDKVWGEHMAITERAVDGHIRTLRRALAPMQSASMLKTVRGSGYLFAGQPRPVLQSPMLVLHHPTSGETGARTAATSQPT